ncbi:MAG: thiamine-phosphate kinase [Dehalococcoidia bacterium]|nr:thiamine-phosphate kinase [Dehalococcoidia bacterium]
MKVSELGEFGLIDLIRSSVARYDDCGRTPWREIVVGIGDDAAAWRADGQILLATTDTLVQEIHFNLDVISWEELGWKTLAVNLSDIAAMGGIPKYALLSLALPGDLQAEDISRFADGLMRLAGEFRVAVVGGNISAAPNVVITATVIGCSRGEAILKRSTACPGDLIAVTGYPGLSAAGLEMLKGRAISDPEMSSVLRCAHLQPRPRIEEARILTEQGVKTAIDVSDGLVADLDHICECSKVNARIDMQRVPVHPMLEANFPNYRDLALSGGEDYELLFTADEATLARVNQALNCPVAVIGEIRAEESVKRVTVVDSRGDAISYRKGGWEHFKHGVTKAYLA